MMSEREPYRVFLPLDILFGLTGVAIWPLDSFGITTTYSGPCINRPRACCRRRGADRRRRVGAGTRVVGLRGYAMLPAHGAPFARRTYFDHLMWAERR